MKEWNELESGKKFFIAALASAVLAFYACLLGWSASTMTANKAAADANHSTRMTANGVEPGKTPPDEVPATGNFTEVTVGTYFEDIDSFSLKDSFWSANFYLWFKWKGDAKLDPAGKFIMVDGAVLKKEVMDEYHGDDGMNYQRLKVSAKVIKFFDPLRVPIESHMLNVYLEDGARDANQIRYVADSNSNFSSRLKIPGYKINKVENVVKRHTYKSSYGDPRAQENSRKTFSQYVAAITISRADYGFYCKIFLSLFAAQALTLASFFIRVSDVAPRFAIPTGAFFGAVANSYVANSVLPPSGVFGLVDYVAGLGLFTIFLSVVMSLVSSHICIKKEDKAMSYVFDRVMFLALTICCVAANVLLPWSARG